MTLNHIHTNHITPSDIPTNSAHDATWVESNSLLYASVCPDYLHFKAEKWHWTWKHRHNVRCGHLLTLLILETVFSMCKPMMWNILFHMVLWKTPHTPWYALNVQLNHSLLNMLHLKTNTILTERLDQISWSKLLWGLSRVIKKHVTNASGV